MTPEQLKNWRDELGWSQWKLAKLLQVHRRTISAWEHGRQASPPFLPLALAELTRRHKPSFARARGYDLCLSAGDSRTWHWDTLCEEELPSLTRRNTF
jgi:DNA-binding XRE family transcriptional regulator